MGKTNKMVVILLTIAFCFTAVGNLAAQEEGIMDKLKIEAGVTASMGFYDFFDVVEEQYKDEWTVTERDLLISSGNLISMLTSLRLSLQSTALYPVYEVGILSVDAGGELALGFGMLRGLPFDFALRAASRISLTPTDNEGVPGDTIYVQPFLGYYGVGPDIPAAFKASVENDEFSASGADDVEQDDVDGSFGSYFDIGARFGYVLTNGIGAFADIEYPIGAVSHLRISIGSTYVF